MADEKRKGDCIEGGPSQDGVDRRGFLKCMAWAGTGLVWTLSGGIPTSRLFGATGHEAHHGDNGFSFVQVSDSHIGFNKGANPDVTGTFQAAIDKINSLPAAPDLIIHTGDLSQISKPGEFDTVDQVLRGAKAKQVFYVPGEHDFAVDNGQQFLQRYGKGTKGAGWQSFDHKGVHFIGLVNVANLKAGGMGSLGADQLEWVEDDVKGLSASTPIVVFAHIPLWAVYPEWGWGTQDSAQAPQAQAAPASGDSSSGEVAQVSIDNFAFTPQKLTVKRGTSISWTNHDDIPHTVDQDDHIFSSSVLDTNQKFQHTFTDPGQCLYYCRLHPKMTGTVVVE